MESQGGKATVRNAWPASTFAQLNLLSMGKSPGTKGGISFSKNE